jgi:hypothetical protein
VGCSKLSTFTKIGRIFGEIMLNVWARSVNGTPGQAKYEDFGVSTGGLKPGLPPKKQQMNEK